MKITEKQLRNIIKEAINELDWKTYANAAKKAKKWREENPYKYDRNRGMSFDRAAVNAFNKQHDIENLPNFGGERGNINFRSDNGNVELSGSRDHDFGFDKDGMLNHNVSHLSKEYGKDGKYGRARMWDRAYETTPEEFYDNEEMATKFRNAEKEVEDFNSGKYSYDIKKGWHLNESILRKIIKESINNVLKDFDASAYDEWDAELSRLFGEVKVSRFYSGGNRLVIAAKHGTDIKGVIKFAKECGLKFEDYGENGVYAMLTFKQNMNL
jgi:hypothetical protein